MSCYARKKLLTIDQLCSLFAFLSFSFFVGVGLLKAFYMFSLLQSRIQNCEKKNEANDASIRVQGEKSNE